jgi:uncharacterized membrane protein
MCYIAYGHYCKRGFLSLPFCPIYGAPVCLFILLFGTPKCGVFARAFKRVPLRGQYADGWKRAFSYVAYFFFSALSVTVVEYAVGAYFRSRGVKLWGYSSYPANYKGLICLPVSLLWGLLFTLFATFLWKPLYKVCAKLPKPIVFAVNVLLWTCISLDFSFRFFSI